jgi:hypothetical protein
MGKRFRNHETPYVRFHIRSDVYWHMLSWKAQGLLLNLATRTNIHGEIELGRHEISALAIHLRSSESWPEIEPLVAELIRMGWLLVEDDRLVICGGASIIFGKDTTTTWSKSAYPDVYRRDGLICRYCAAVLSPGESTIDHIVPRIQNGSDEIDNLVVACMPCNTRKGGRTPEQAGMTLILAPEAK